jgi:predicted RNase H-like HicB family nuclease
MNYHFAVHSEAGGYWASCLELNGCATQADTAEELSLNCVEALNLYLEEPPESEAVFSLPYDHYDEEQGYLKIPVDPEIGFAVLLRHYRHSHHLTQKQVAAKLGMKNVYSYQRLEKRSNPTLRIMKKVKTIFPEMMLDVLLMS